MKQTLVPTVLAAVLIAGCTRETTPATDTDTPAAPAVDAARPVATPPAAPAAPATDAAQAPFDIGAFSGTFASGPTRLELHADGTYLFDAEGESGRGTWTHEPGTGVIRLDPGTKDAVDRVFRVRDKDVLAPVPAPGQAPMPVLARVAAS